MNSTTFAIKKDFSGYLLDPLQIFKSKGKGQKPYISEKSMAAISEYLSIPRAEIYGVVTFYSRFTLKPKGKYHIAICLGTACFVKGSEQILDRAKERLKIDVGETTKDGMFSLEATRCIGACGLAPVFTVNGEVYGKATVKMMDEIIDKIMENPE